MNPSTSRLQIAARIHHLLLRDLGQGIDIDQMLRLERYARDVLLVCDALRAQGLHELSARYREAEHEDELRKVGYSKERRVDPQIIVGLLVSVKASLAAETGWAHFLYVPNGDNIPFWVEMGAYTAIASGTLFGGWRIVHTMGSRITKLRPVGGSAAETAGALTILLAFWFVNSLLAPRAASA